MMECVSRSTRNALNSYVATFVCLVLGAGCSTMRASEALTTPFLTRGHDLHPWHDHAPWDAVWSARPGEIMVKRDDVRSIYIAPVSIEFLNMKQDESGQWVRTRAVDQDDVKAITDLIRQSFTDAIKKHPESNLIAQDRPGPGTLTLEIALVELVPTKVLMNSAADIGGVLLPGSKAIEQTAAAGAQAAGGAFAAGSIAIEMRLSDGGTGEELAQVKDRQTDPASLLPNVRDFEQFGWSRHTVRDWAAQFVEVFSTPAGTRVRPDSAVSFTPW